MGGAESKARARSYRLHNQLAERPGPPGKPLLVPSDKRSPEPDVVTIRWEPPLYDGGLPITGYLVEHRRTGSPHWVRSAPQLVTSPELTLAGLEPGWRYQFRVSAQNAAGLSDPGELSDLLTVTLQRTAASAPFFVKELRDTVALENEKAELSVQVRGTPTPAVAWFKDGVEIFSSRSYRVVTDGEVSTLVIHQAALSDEGEVKCSATNRVGYAVTRAKLVIEAPPSIRLPRQYEEGLLFEKDEVIRLKVSVAGRPVPEVSWLLNGEPVPGGGRYEAGHSERYATLRVGEARREDRGEYQVRAVNKLGEDVASFLVTVADRPMPPGRAKVVMTLGRSVTLSWSAPEDDGGCKIGNYIVEYFRVGWNMWLKAATCRQLTTTLGELIEGSEYKFRVKAENPYGVSDPSPESDVVFIPDPKRGLLEPPEHKAEEMDIWMEDKKRPVSPSQVLEEQYGERKTKKKRGPMVPPRSPKPDSKDLMIPSDKHSMLSEDSMSPPATPENPPMVPPKRRSKVERIIEKDVLEDKEMARRIEEKRRVEEFKKLEEKRQAEEAKKAEEQKKAELKKEEKKKEEKKKDALIRSEALSPQSPRMERDRFHGSSELMLVLLPHSRATTEERETTQSKKELFESSMALEGDVAPPMSLSAPELGSGDPPEMPRVRAAFSSTELLHERAMARFYQDMEQEEADTKRHGSVQRRRSFGSRPRDNLEKTASLQDIVSSMRSLNEQIEKKVDPPREEKEEERPGTSVGISKSDRIAFMGDSLDSEISVDDRRKTLLAQTSEEDMEYEDSSFDEDEEDEYEEEESIMDEQGEEEIDEELEEEEEELSMFGKRGSLYTSESEDERFSYSLEEDTYHPMSVNIKYNEDSLISEYEGRGPLILPSLPQPAMPPSVPTMSEPIPSSSTSVSSSSVKLKPILKKPSNEGNTAKNMEDEEVDKVNNEELNTQTLPSLSLPSPSLPSPSLPSPEKRFEPNFSPVMPKPILKVRDRSQERLSPAFPRKGAPVAEVEPELNLVSSRGNLDEGSDYETSVKKKQVRIEEPDEVAARLSPDVKDEKPKTPIETTPSTPQKQQQPEEQPRKRGASLDDEAEAARVLISHYSDIVAEYGKNRRPPKRLYLNYEALKAAAEEEEKNMPGIPDITVTEPSASSEAIETQEDTRIKEIEIQDIMDVNDERKTKIETETPMMDIEEPKKVVEETIIAVHKPIEEISKPSMHFEANTPKKRDRSVDRRDRSVDKQNRSVENRDTSVDRRDRSIDKRDRSVGSRDTSLDRRDKLVDTRNRQIEYRDRSLDRRDRPLDKRDRSVESRDRSVDRRDRSLDKRDRSVGSRDPSLDRRGRSTNLRDGSVDRRDMSTDRASNKSKAPSSEKRRSPSPWKMKKEKGETVFPQEKTDIARTPSPTLSSRKYTTTELKVHSFFDFLMDFSLFLLATWLYLFKDERLSIPVLGLMIYRQASEAFQRKMQALREKSRRLMFWRRKQ